ncbi:hypothetical protein [Rickettsia australis]|uniref:hypothetical protein n=1 Tax=Rickettsia australis TaxID=787 RepID=UPI0002EA8915|nr:hypothetical protein [Rickettsia australis]
MLPVQQFLKPQIIQSQISQVISLVPAINLTVLIGMVNSNGNSTNTITNLKILKAGADKSTVTINVGGNMSIAKIQGVGTGTIELTQPTSLVGTITGNGVNLMFTGPSSVSVAIGSSTSKVSYITVSTDLLNRTGDVNAGNIILIDGGDIKFNGQLIL